MIQDVGNIELFELLETDPKTQSTACLSFWNVGIVYCTCGHFLQKETEAKTTFRFEFSMDLLLRSDHLCTHCSPLNGQRKTQHGSGALV